MSQLEANSSRHGANIRAGDGSGPWSSQVVRSGDGSGQVTGPVRGQVRQVVESGRWSGQVRQVVRVISEISSSLGPRVLLQNSFID